jgi:hypothetical protein
VVALLADTTTATSDAADRKVQRKPGRKSTADAITRLRSAHPELSQVAVAKRLKLTDRTVRKYWPATTPNAHPTVRAVPDPESDAA